MNWGKWQAAQSCTGVVTFGAKSMLAFALEEMPDCWSGGILNCRSVVGSDTTSTHGEGRGIDVMVPNTEEARAAMYAFIRRIGQFGEAMGVQCIIFDRTIWSQRSPEGRRYEGLHPHRDHAHIELNWLGANRLTLTSLRVNCGTTNQGIEVPEEEEALPVNTHRVVSGWGETPADIDLVEKICSPEELDLRFHRDGPAYYFHASLEDTKRVEALIEDTPGLHRFDAVRTNRGTHVGMGVHGGIGQTPWTIILGEIEPAPDYGVMATNIREELAHYGL